MTENVRRIEAAKGCSRHPQSHWSMEQIVCQPTLQVTLFALIMCLLAALWGCSDYQSGEAAYKRGDYETALKKLRPLAEKGNSKAQFRLGWMYGHAEGVIQNNEEAVEWYRKAAQQDHAIAQFNLGASYAEASLKTTRRQSSGIVKLRSKCFSTTLPWQVCNR